jgi:hypothetical protein
VINGEEEANKNYVRGYYSLGRSIIDNTVNIINNIADNYSDLQGFLDFHSLGGRN